MSQEATEGLFIYDLGNRQWNIPALRLLLKSVIKGNNDFQDFEVTHATAIFEPFKRVHG